MAIKSIQKNKRGAGKNGEPKGEGRRDCIRERKRVSQPREERKEKEKKEKKKEKKREKEKRKKRKKRKKEFVFFLLL